LSDFLLIVIIVELLAILAVLINLAFKARNFGEALAKIARLAHITRPGGHHGFDGVPCSAFSIWCFTNGQWVLLAHCGQPGCDCGPPPAMPGSYEEQVIRKECPPR
jgi:hypothetical protein